MKPPLVQNTTSYKLRNSSDLRSIQTRMNIFYNPFLTSTIKAWKELPEETKTAPSVVSFKYRLYRDLLTPPNTLTTALASLLMPISTAKILFLVHVFLWGLRKCILLLFPMSQLRGHKYKLSSKQSQDLNTNQLLCGIPNATVTNNEFLICQGQEFDLEDSLKRI